MKGSDIMEILKIIDHTLLKPNATKKDIELLCGEAKQYGFGAVCVNPCFVKYSKELLKDTDVKVCTVIGFPLGANSISTKVVEAKNAVKDGAKEIDIVINIGEAKVANYDYIQDELMSIVEGAREINKDVFVKVILENCYLTDFEKIKVCSISKEVGADAVKTSTGFGIGGATVEDITLMRQTVGPIMGVKAAGGVKTLEDVEKMIEAGATRIGTSQGVAIAKEYKLRQSDENIKKAEATIKKAESRENLEQHKVEKPKAKKSKSGARNFEVK